MASSLCDTMWEESLSIAEEAYQTNFIQGIINGTLDPNVYSAFMNQDISYVMQAAECFGKVASLSADEEFKQFAEGRRNYFLRCGDDMCKKFYINDHSAIKLGDAISDYCQYLHQIAKEMEPIYFLVAMIPCSKLWPWLAEKMQDKEAKPHLYSFWAKENTSHSCSSKLEIFVDAHKMGLDEQKAMYIYQTCMKSEVNFFKSAMGDAPSPIAMPPISSPGKLPDRET